MSALKEGPQVADTFVGKKFDQLLIKLEMVNDTCVVTKIGDMFLAGVVFIDSNNTWMFVSFEQFLSDPEKEIEGDFSKINSFVIKKIIFGTGLKKMMLLGEIDCVGEGNVSE